MRGNTNQQDSTCILAVWLSGRRITLDPQERIEAFWAGEQPDQIPYTIYWNEWRHSKDDPAWGPMFAAGLRVTYTATTVGTRLKDVVSERTTVEYDGKQFDRQIMRTPVGEIYRDSTTGWVQKYWLETAEDYRVLQYIVDNTELYPNYELYHKLVAETAGHGIVCVGIGSRSPLQNILVDYVGLENFALHLYDFADEIESLYASMLRNMRKRVEIVAGGPGRYVGVLENFTAETMGPQRFAKYHMPVYQELFPMLQASGKIVGTHYDGRLESCKDLIAQAPTDLIESLTPPPEGDMTLAEARQAWPTKLFWSNLNVSLYQLPPDKLRAAVLERVQEAAPDGRRLAFEVSEHIPANWKESMPQVIAALNETRVS